LRFFLDAIQESDDLGEYFFLRNVMPVPWDGKEGAFCSSEMSKCKIILKLEILGSNRLIDFLFSPSFLSTFIKVKYHSSTLLLGLSLNFKQV
jgi:hypothetical protein